MKRFVAALLMGLALVSDAVLAQAVVSPEEGASLSRIRQTGKIYLGVRENSIPLSYLDEQGQAHGFSWALCTRIAEKMAPRLGFERLEKVAVPVSPGARFMMVRTGTIDLECGNTTNTASRQRQVSFSHTFFVAGVKALVRADSGLTALADFAGKRLVTTVGSTAERTMRTAAALRGVALTTVQAVNHQQSLELIRSGKADAFILDDIVLAGLKAGAADGERFVILDESMAIEPYGLMMNRDDPAFKQLVDEILAGMMADGEFEALYQQWFLSPIPPNGINLNVPMSDLLKELVRNPNDRAG